jgi:hypothetical protein
VLDEVRARLKPLLSLAMTWQVHEGLGIPAESLIKKQAA